LGGNTHEIQRAGIGETIVVQPGTEPDRAVRIARQHVLFDQIVDDHIDGRKRSLDGLRDRVDAGWRAGFVKIINDLQSTVDTAHARTARSLAAVRLFHRDAVFGVNCR